MSRLAVLLVTTCLLGIGPGSSVAAQPPDAAPGQPADAGATLGSLGPSVWHVRELEVGCNRPSPMRSDSLVIAPDGQAWVIDKRGIREAAPS
jgi:hypothetical protein